VREVVENSCRGLKAVVEQEQDPCVEKGATFRGRDDCGFIVKVVLSEITNCCEDLISLATIDDVVSTPDFVCLWMSLDCECSYDSEVVTATLEGCEEI
jgi:hypothetical protein